MVLFKLNLVNKKIADFLEIDINTLVWIFICMITSFIIMGAYLKHGNDLNEKYSSNFSTTEVDITQNSTEKTIQPSTDTNTKSIFDTQIFAVLFFLILISHGLWSVYIILTNNRHVSGGMVAFISIWGFFMIWLFIGKIM